MTAGPAVLPRPAIGRAISTLKGIGTKPALVNQSNDDSYRSVNTLIDLPPDMIDLVNAFPFGVRDSPYSKGMFLDYIPDFRKAQRLADLYFINIGWM